MNREELYYKTVNTLLDAYNDDKLRHCNCYQCAVGNICRETAQKMKIDTASWKYLFMTSDGKQYGINELYDSPKKIENARKLIKETGYTVEELAKVEFAFETSIYNSAEGYKYWMGDNTDNENEIYQITKKGQYMGLCAVLDVLKEIHEVDKESSNKSQERLDTIFEEKKEKVFS